jgi:Ser/Thr protein kinase RdoA (MazF antagonist)
MTTPNATPPTADIQSIADLFELGDVTAVQHTAKVLCLHTRHGRFALRFFDAGVTRAHAQATQAVRLALVNAGLPCGAPISMAGGGTLIERNGVFGELQAWIPHTDDGGNWANLAPAAAMLRHMHAVMAECQARPEQHDDPWRSPGALAQQLAADTPSLRRQAQQCGVLIDRHLQRAADILDMLHAGGALDTCSLQLTHGDFQGPNLLFHEHVLIGVIDFERLERRPQLYDLAWPLVFWRWYGSNLGAYADADWRSARDCCAAYADASPLALSENEWATLPLLMAYIPARGIADAARQAEPVAEALAFATALEFAERLAQHPEAALARLRG